MEKEYKMADETKVEKTAEEIAATTAKAEQVVADKKLEATVKEGLSKAFTDSNSTPAEEPKPAEESDGTDESTPDEPAEESDDADDSTPGEEPEPAEGDEPEEDASTPEKTPADTGEVKIPDQYIRAAIHQKWSIGDIKELQEANPKLALKTFKKLYDDTNRLSQEFASIGRKRMEDARKPVEKKAEEKPKDFAIDLTKVKAEYGDDPIVGVVEALAEHNAELMKKLEQVVPVAKPSGKSEAEIRAEIRENQAVEKQVNAFFGDRTMELYTDFYGTVSKGSVDWSSLTGEQQTNRMTVLNLADQICIGAQSQGKNMTVEEAMEKAHLIVSARVLESIVREDIKKQVSKFSKAKTLHPHATTTVADSNKPKTEEELNAKVALGLKKVFG
jgi:hypothetical protein